MAEDLRSAASGRSLILRRAVLGKLSPSSLAALRKLPGEFARAFSWGDDAVTLMLPDENTAADDWLARFVTCLDAEGHLPPGRGERLDVVTPTGILTGLTLERSAFRFLGLTTRCIAAVALTPDRCVWLGRRSHRKRINPGLWDTLARGLVAAGETPENALRRETLEEAGLTEPGVRFATQPLLHHTCRKVPEGILSEITYTYRAETAHGIVPHNRDGEVAEFKAVPLEALPLLARDEQLTCDTEASLRQLNLL